MLSDREKFSAFCAARYPALVAYAGLFLKGEDRSWAEDVVQDVLFSVWKRRSLLRKDPAQVQAYMLKSVYNRSLNYLKHSRLRHQHESSLSDFITIAEQYYDPDRNEVIRAIFNADLGRALNHSVETLPEKQREVFRMRFEDNMPERQIAEALGISVRTVEAHIYQAMKSLRASMREI